jgi:hypothetical protein
MNEQNLEDHNNKTIIVDICIDNCNIRASKPADRFQNILYQPIMKYREIYGMNLPSKVFSVYQILLCLGNLH